MQPSLSIQKATIADAFELAMFSGESFFSTYAAFNTPEDMHMYVSKAFAVTTIENEINIASNTFLLLRQDTYLIGYAKLSKKAAANNYIPSTAIELARLYIAKEQQKKGFGNILLQHCYNYAVANNCHYIWLGVWELNTLAIDFYTKAGFTKVGEQTFLLGNDVQNDFVMMKSL